MEDATKESAHAIVEAEQIEQKKKDDKLKAEQLQRERKAMTLSIDPVRSGLMWGIVFLLSRNESLRRFLANALRGITQSDS